MEDLICRKCENCGNYVDLYYKKCVYCGEYIGSSSLYNIKTREITDNGNADYFIRICKSCGVFSVTSNYKNFTDKCSNCYKSIFYPTQVCILTKCLNKKYSEHLNKNKIIPQTEVKQTYSKSIVPNDMPSENVESGDFYSEGNGLLFEFDNKITLTVDSADRESGTFEPNPNVKYVLGREGELQDVIIKYCEDRGISRKHCCLRYDTGYWYLSTMKPECETYLNGERVMYGKEYIIVNNSKLRMGDRMDSITFTITVD